MNQRASHNAAPVAFVFTQNKIPSVQHVQKLLMLKAKLRFHRGPRVLFSHP
jgi:hypothetical protein